MRATDPHDDTDPLLPEAPVQARIADDAVAVDTPLFVTIDSFDSGIARHGPCAWTPRVAADGAVLLPSRGDLALVVEDEDERPWILTWWPYEL